MCKRISRGFLALLNGTLAAESSNGVKRVIREIIKCLKGGDLSWIRPEKKAFSCIFA